MWRPEVSMIPAKTTAETAKARRQRADAGILRRTRDEETESDGGKQSGSDSDLPGWHRRAGPDSPLLAIRDHELRGFPQKVRHPTYRQRLTCVRDVSEGREPRAHLVENEREGPAATPDRHGPDVVSGRDGAPAVHEEGRRDHGRDEPEHVESRPDTQSYGDSKQKGGQPRLATKVVRQRQRGKPHGGHPDRHAAVVENGEIEIGRVNGENGPDDEPSQAADFHPDERDEAGDAHASKHDGARPGGLVPADRVARSEDGGPPRAVPAPHGGRAAPGDRHRGHPRAPAA